MITSVVGVNCWKVINIFIISADQVNTEALYNFCFDN